MNKAKTKLLAMGLVAAFVVASCGGSSSSTDSGATESGSSESNSLTDAWANDWEIAGLENPGVAVSDWAISAVDTSGFKKDGPYKIGFASQGPTNYGVHVLSKQVI